MKMTIVIFNEWLKALQVAAFLFVAICFVMVLLHLNKTLTKVDTTVDSLNAEIKAIDVTRKSLDDLIVQTTVLIIDADNAALEEKKMVDNIGSQLSATLANVNLTVQAATKNQNELTLHSVQVMDAATASLRGIQPVLDQTTIVLKSVDESAKSVNKVVSNPAIPKTLENVQSMTISGSSILKDGADETHKLVHPDKVKLGFWGSVLSVEQIMRNKVLPKISLF